MQSEKAIKRRLRKLETEMVKQVKRGAVTTSGDARRFLLKGGVRYGHILDPRNGWPVKDAPRSVTVLPELPRSATGKVLKAALASR